MLDSLVQPLFEGPIDTVGDIHGEIDAFRDLLGHLGYADDGSHPQGRRLVFLGDLTDRGPDNPQWTDDDFKQLVTQMQHCGFGWLRTEGVRRKLKTNDRQLERPATLAQRLGMPESVILTRGNNWMQSAIR